MSKGTPLCPDITQGESGNTGSGSCRKQGFEKTRGVMITGCNGQVEQHGTDQDHHDKEQNDDLRCCERSPFLLNKISDPHFSSIWEKLYRRFSSCSAD